VGAGVGVGAVEAAVVAAALAESWGEMDGRVEARAKVEGPGDVEGLQAQLREMQAALRRSDAERTELQRRNARLKKDTRRATTAAQAVVRPAYAALRQHEETHKRRQEEAATRHEEKEQERRAGAINLTQAFSAERAQRDARAVDAAVRRTIRATRGAPPPLRAEPGPRGSRLHARGRAGHPPEPSEGRGAVGLRGRSFELYEQQEPWHAAAVSERGEHRSSQDEHRAWLEQLAALPGLSSETSADGGLRQMLTEALGEEVHRALLTELLTQKAAEAQPAG
jgi:hypothetical protein